MAETTYDEIYRPQFHFSARQGWVNDPNGMVFYQGEYHLFFQHNPQGIEWGNMTWGHAVSPDLVHWEQLPHALEPDQLGTIFSGSAVVDWQNTAGFQVGSEPALVAIYTAAGGTSPESAGQPFTQCLAYSTDRGRTWTKYSGNPVLPHIVGGNRDPRIFWHTPSARWIMVLYLDGCEFGFYASTNLKEWIPLSRIDLPGLHEVPDLFELPVDGDLAHRKWVLLAGDERFEPATNGKYFVGTFDGTTFVMEGGPYALDFGQGCYSTQTFSDIPAADGRRIQIAWMSRDFRKPGYPGMPFNGQFGFPSELTLRTLSDGVRLCRRPVREIASLHARQHKWYDRPLRPDENLLAGIDHDLFDMRVRMELTDDAQWEMRVRGTPILYDGGRCELRCFGKSGKLAPVEGKIQLHILVDRTSIEIFGNDGAFSMSGYFVPAEDAQPLQLGTQRGSVRLASLEVYELRSIWG